MGDSLTADDHSPELRLCTSSAADGDVSGGGGSISGRYKLMSPAKLSISRASSCLSIPSGLSPNSFLESPVLLSNMKAEPSPTTGSFMNPQLWHSGSTGFSLAANFSRNNTVDQTRNDFFEFKPHAVTNSVSGLPPVAPMKSPGTNDLRGEPCDQVQTQFQSQPFESTNTINNEMTSCANESSHPVATVTTGIDSKEMNQGMTSNTAVQASQLDHKDIGNSVTAERSSDDGYNWRKYGQKIVKGSEFPRSYYKCTHPNCEVKKIFERSYEGKITEIVYKGTHDHPKPQPARRFTAGAIMSIQEQADHVASGEDKSAVYGLNSRNNDPNGTPQQSPRRTNDNCLEGTNQINDINDEGDEDDQFSKRRKLDEMSIDVTPVVRPIREPRVVVQTVSEVDILDDGYRWRKYGQKVVRGNPNPRSYYKCTNVGCPVRKHVERASHDPKAVITTYEGKHNHDVPTARNSSHDMAGPGPGARSANMTPLSRGRTDGNDCISLDLGVGINSVSENRSNERQMIGPGPMQFQGNRAGSIFNAVQLSPMSTFFGVVNGGSYVTRDNQAVSHNFQNPNLNHSSNQYPQNLEGVPLGP